MLCGEDRKTAWKDERLRRVGKGVNGERGGRDERDDNEMRTWSGDLDEMADEGNNLNGLAETWYT
jgi:hypothetical protein